MAKRKKLQDNNPPRRVEIRGQDHLLAYITPEEAALLKANGGSGEPGPMGIPAFFDVGEGMGGYDSGTEGAAETAGGLGDPDAGVSGRDQAADDRGFSYAELEAGAAARNSIDAANKALLDAASQKPKVTQVSDYGMPSTAEQLAQRVAQSYIDYAGIMGPELYSAGNVGGSLLDFFKTGSTGGVPIRSNYFADPTTLSAFKDIALGQIPGRMDKAKAGYGVPGGFGAAMGAVGQFTLGRMQKALEEGGRPVFDAQGQLKGVFSEGLFGGEVYTGTPVEGVEGTGYDEGGRDGYEEVKPVNPETGQCDAGYIFDEDLQACRLDTGGVASSSPTGTTFAPGAYARMSLLDQAPQGLLQVAGQPYDFDAANKAFRMATATRPEYYSDPYDLTGYTLLA